MQPTSIAIISRPGCPQAFEIKEFLFRNIVPFDYYEFGSDPFAELFLTINHLEDAKLPVICFPDGDVLQTPNMFEIAERIGLHQKPKCNEYDLAIMGAGPAGLTAAIYAGSEGLRTVVIERHSPGGRAGSTSLIENLIAHPDGITGAAFTERSRRQAEKFGVEFVAPVELNAINTQERGLQLSLSSGIDFHTRTLIIAVGVRYRMLQLPGMEHFLGTSIFYGSAMTEGRRNQDKEVFIVGGANSAGQAAMYFSRFARHVNLVVRGETINKRMSNYLVQEIAETDNIRVHTNSEVIGVQGSSNLESLTIKNVHTGVIKTHQAHNLFLLIGGEPYQGCIGAKFLRDHNGFILTGSTGLEHHADFNSYWKLPRRPFDLETNIAGVFAAGDVRSGTPKRMAAAIGDGANAVTQVNEYLSV
jgi:thioredoxin reductase (NADPH)